MRSLGLFTTTPEIAQDVLLIRNLNTNSIVGVAPLLRYAAQGNDPLKYRQTKRESPQSGLSLTRVLSSTHHSFLISYSYRVTQISVLPAIAGSTPLGAQTVMRPLAS